MSQLVTSVSQVVENIQSYNQQVKDFVKLLPFNRHWYALKTKERWLFGPSKFIGYEKMNLRKYESDEDRNGRISEAVLQHWADLIEGGDPEYENLHSELRKFCARFGKKPNKKARISVINAERGDRYARISRSGPGGPPSIRQSTRSMTLPMFRPETTFWPLTLLCQCRGRHNRPPTRLPWSDATWESRHGTILDV